MKKKVSVLKSTLSSSVALFCGFLLLTGVACRNSADVKTPEVRSFAIGFALGDFAAANNESGLISRATLHGLHWFPNDGATGSYFMGSINLDIPVTKTQHHEVLELCQTNGAEQVYLRFEVEEIEGGDPNFQGRSTDLLGRLVGYYLVTYQERKVFLEKIEKDRQAPGFVSFSSE